MFIRRFCYICGSREILNTTTLHIDHAFVERLRQQDRPAFERLYDAYSPALYGIALRITNSSALAEDVMQDAFVKIWKNLTSFDVTKGTIFTWMLNITRNTAIDLLRSRKAKATTSMSDDVAYMIEQSNSLTLNTNIIGIKDLVEKLKPEFREVIDAVYFKGLTHEEAADYLNLPLGTLKTRVRGALVELKRIFALLTIWSLLNT